jgi:hypothetical protein
MTTYYWVGGTGNWTPTDTTHWSLSSGGAGGAGPPTATDDVIFDTASGTGIRTVQSYNPTPAIMCRNLTFTTTNTQSIRLQGVFYVSGDVTSSSTSANNLSWISGDLVLCGSGNTQSVNFPSQTLGGNALPTVICGCPQINAGGGTVQLTGSLGLVTGVDLIIQNKSFNQNSQTLQVNSLFTTGDATTATTASFSTIKFGQAFNTGYILDFTGTNITVDLSAVTITIGGGTITSQIYSPFYINLAGRTLGTLQNGSITDAQTTNAGLYNLVVEGITTISTLTWPFLNNTTNSQYQYLRLGAFNGTSCTITTINATGYDNARRLQIVASYKQMPTQLQLTTSTTSFSYVDFGGIAKTSTAISGTSIGNLGGCSNITFTAAKTVYIASSPPSTPATGYATLFATGSPSGSTGTANIPLPQDTTIYANSSSYAIGGFATSLGTLNITGSGSLTGNCYVTYGINFTGSTGAATANPYFNGYNINATINLAGTTGANTFNLECPGGTVSFNDAVSSTTNYGFNFQCGQLVLNNQTIQINSMSFYGPRDVNLLVTGSTSYSMWQNCVNNGINFGTSGLIKHTSATNVWNQSVYMKNFSFFGTSSTRYIQYTYTGSTARSFTTFSAYNGTSAATTGTQPLNQGNVNIWIDGGTGIVAAPLGWTMGVTFTTNFSGTIGNADSGILCFGDFLVLGSSATLATNTTQANAVFIMAGDSGTATLNINNSLTLDRNFLFMAPRSGNNPTFIMGSDLQLAPTLSTGEIAIVGGNLSDGGHFITANKITSNANTYTSTPLITSSQTSNTTTNAWPYYPYSQIFATPYNFANLGYYGLCIGQSLTIAGSATTPSQQIANGTYYVNYISFVSNTAQINFGISTSNTLNSNPISVTTGASSTAGQTATSNFTTTRGVTFTLSGQWLVGAAGGTAWNFGPGATNGNTSVSGIDGNIVILSPSSATFAGGNNNYKATIVMQGGTGTITGSNTFTDIGSNVGVVTQLPAGLTTTFTQFTFGGSSGHLRTLQSSTSGTQATIACASSVTANYITAKDLNGSGGPWYFVNSTNVSNNTNITFSAPPVTTTPGFFFFY